MVSAVVVGGGVAGLTAARALLVAAPDASVTVLEGADRVGGKLRTARLDVPGGPLPRPAGLVDGGLPVEDGVEALLVRDPAAADLAHDLGLGDRLVHPATTAATVWSRGAARPLPGGTVLGLPADLRSLSASGVLSPGGLLRVPLDLVLPGRPVAEDVAVGVLVARRLGREVVDRLLDPLLGGVYAGRADALSLDATVPRLAEAARRSRSLLLAAAEARPAPGGGPVFAGLRGGTEQLVDALVADVRARGGVVRTGATVRGLARTSSGWRLEVGSAAHPEAVDADGVVLAVPAAPAARLLRAEVPAAATELAAVEYASVALVTLAYPAGALHPPPGSGLLVPAVEGRAVKAVTFSSRKWAHVAAAAPDVELVRASLGRHGEEGVLVRDDAGLVDLVRADLADLVGASGPPLASRVARWGGALPQYAVGHRARVARVRGALAAEPAITACGAAYDGVGVPACVRSGTVAAAALLDALPRDAAAAGTATPGPPAAGSPARGRGATLEG